VSLCIPGHISPLLQRARCIQRGAQLAEIQKSPSRPTSGPATGAACDGGACGASTQLHFGYGNAPPSQSPLRLMYLLRYYHHDDGDGVENE